MFDGKSFRSILVRFGRLALGVLASTAKFSRRLLLSARAWVLFILLVIAALVAYYVLSDRHTPFTTDAYVQTYVVQVAPRVEGQVVHVYVRENQAVKKDDLLFEIDRRPFEHRLNLLVAKRVNTVQEVAQLESDLSTAKAEDTRLVAEAAYARAVYEQEKEIYKHEATTDRKYLDAIQKIQGSGGGGGAVAAQIRKAEQALAARIGSEHALVAEVEAQLAEARLNLEWTRVYAPSNGYVTNVQLREGSYIHVGTPVLTCIDRDQWWVVANFRENGLENVRPGQRVGLTFSTYPGRKFAGVVESVGWGVNQGQSTPSGNLPAISEPQNWIRLAQRFQVRITPDVGQDHPMRVGATATVAIYTRERYWLNWVTELWQDIEAELEYLR